MNRLEFKMSRQGVVRSQAPVDEMESTEFSPFDSLFMGSF